MNWTETTVGQLVEVKHGFAFKGKHFSDSGRYVVLTPGNCENSGGFRSRGDKEKWYSSDVPDGYLLDEGELLVVMTDLVNSAPVLGGSFMIPEPDKYLHNQRLGLVKVLDEEATDRRFLYYLFNTHDYRGQVRGSASGSTVRHTSPGRIKDCTVRIPVDFEDQRRIASILSTYDDLIDNNRRRIALLEEAARQLYKEWFVRFRFPGHEHVQIIDGLPEGWESKTLGDCVDVVKDAADPKALEPCTPYIGLEHLPRRSITLGNWETAEKVESGKFRFIEQDIIFGKIRPYFHKVGFALTEGITSSDAIVMRPKDVALWAFILMEVSSDRFVALASQTVKEGSKMPRANWDVLKAHILAIPPEDLRETFCDQITAITSQTKALSLAITQAISARDLLLPRLMNGNLAV